MLIKVNVNEIVLALSIVCANMLIVEIVCEASMIHESQLRTIVKTLTWRILASLDTFAIAWYITSDPLSGATIAGIEVLTKIGLYYAHERGWSHVDWGLTPFAKKAIDSIATMGRPTIEDVIRKGHERFKNK